MESTNHDTVKRSKGIDVSHYNGVIDWKQVKAAGYEFAFLKATEGVDLLDETFAANRKAAREAGICVGFYHFFVPHDSIDEQVNFFVKTVGQLELDTLRPVLDCENAHLWKGFTVQERVQRVVEWCQKVKKALGVQPMLYGSPSFFDEILGNSPELAAYDLWIANYNVAEPTLPKPWSTWLFWQSSEKGTVPGISGDVDIDCFNGSDMSKAPRSGDTPPPVDNPTDISATALRIFLWTVGILYVIGLIAVIAEQFHH